MQLSQLLAPYFCLQEADDREITQLCLSSRDVKPGALFFAYPGESIDGRDFIEDAIKNGAVAVIAECRNTDRCGGGFQARHVDTENVVFISLVDVQQKISPIAQLFYHYPAKQMQIIGVTGTNGKTSVTYILAQILNFLGTRTAIMGTLGIGEPGALVATGVTTPDPISIQRSLAELNQKGYQVLAMEVSSHALTQGRVRGLQFDAAIFTNLTQDHLDYHGTMEAYGKAKERFLNEYVVKNAIFNQDDAWCEALYQRYKNTVTHCFLYSAHTSKIRLEQTQLIGQFNLQNILAAVTCLLSLGYDEKLIMATLPKIVSVPGRLELVKKSGAPCCVIDYAHTPDALKKALCAVREFTVGKIYCVFGCGGNRDTSKRPLMAKVAEQYSDEICVTDDNPRNESSEKILQDIMQGFSCRMKVTIIPDRAAAIETMILRAKEGDTVLIAGKGHENYQIIKDQKIFFSDRLIVETTLEKN